MIFRLSFIERQRFTRLHFSFSKDDAKKFVTLAKKINSEKICLEVSKTEYVQIQYFKCCVRRSCGLFLSCLFNTCVSATMFLVFALLLSCKGKIFVTMVLYTFTKEIDTN